MSSIMQSQPVAIGDSSLSYDMERNVFFLDTPDKEYVITDFNFWPSASTVTRMVICLSFMAAAAEAQDAMNRGRFSDNSGIFEPDLMQWCQENASEIDGLLCELEGEKP